MNFSDLDTEKRFEIWKSLCSRRYYLLTGAGTSVDSTSATGALPTARQLKDRLCEVAEIDTGKTLQQAFSLLTPEQVNSEITERFTVNQIGATSKNIARIPWKRIYTFNVDDTVENYAAERCATRDAAKTRFHKFNFPDSFKDIQPDQSNSIVHLHGSVRQSQRGYIFSRDQYASNMAKPNCWMMTLAQLMRSEPFIVAGTTLDEIDVSYYLQMRSEISEYDPSLPPAILIEPYADKLTRKLCDDHGFFLFEGMTTDFFEKLEAEFGRIDDAFDEPEYDEPYLTALSFSQRIRFKETFERVSPLGDSNHSGASFLLGADITWSLVRGKADIPRDVTVSMLDHIARSLREELEFFLIFDDPATGKSSLLKRLAFRCAEVNRNVFFFRGQEFLSEEAASEIFSNIIGDVFIFIDNFADFVSYFEGVSARLRGKRVIIIGTERIYRSRYIEDALSDHDIAIVRSSLDLSQVEARRLIRAHGEYGLADFKTSDSAEVIRQAKIIQGESISIASCRIQNNFISFDRIVRDIVKQCADSELMLYVVTGLARHCYGGGIARSILFSISQATAPKVIGDLNQRLPLKYDTDRQGFVVPARTAMAERVIEVVRQGRPELILECMVEIAIHLAPYVNRDRIRARTPESKLAGGLMDFDRTVQRLIDERAEEFYDRVRPHWEWNSRYWEQLALLKLDRFLAGADDDKLLQEAIQNARYAYSIELHPLSLTTLAKTLFVAVESKIGNLEQIFNEGWNLITSSIDIEKNWSRVRSTAFYVCFKGVLNYNKNGGVLTGEQVYKLRDIISITYAKKLKDKKMTELRDEVSVLIS
jgi:SIR2-like domain